MSGTTTTDLGTTTDTTTSDSATVVPVVTNTTPAPATDTATNVAAPTTQAPAAAVPTTTAVPLPAPTTIATTSAFPAPSTFVTSGSSLTSHLSSISPQPSQSSGSPWGGPPPFVTAGGHNPFTSGSSFFGDEKNGAQGLSGGAKAGISVGVVALVASLVALGLLLWRRHKKKRYRESNLTSLEPEQLPSYTESNASRHPPPVGAAIPMQPPKSAMKKVAHTPIMLDLHDSGSSTPITFPQTIERRRSYAMEGSGEPLVLSIWEPANRSSASLATDSPNPVPLPPPKPQRKSNAGSFRPRRKSNLAPVSEEGGDSSGLRSAQSKDDSASTHSRSNSRPTTPRTARTAAYNALDGGSHSNSAPVSPVNSTFAAEPVPPLPHGVSPLNVTFDEREVKNMR